MGIARFVQSGGSTRPSCGGVILRRTGSLVHGSFEACGCSVSPCRRSLSPHPILPLAHRTYINSATGTRANGLQLCLLGARFGKGQRDASHFAHRTLADLSAESFSILACTLYFVIHSVAGHRSPHLVSASATIAGSASRPPLLSMACGAVPFSVVGMGAQAVRFSGEGLASGP